MNIVTVHLRTVPLEVYRALKVMADQNDTSLEKLCIHILREATEVKGE
jgi:hypothetical protein